MEAGTIVGPFRIERLLAIGSIGAVYEATQRSLRRPVALRLIPARHFTGPEQLARFDRRQRLAASLHHPNLVACYEAGEWEGGRFIATRLIRGNTLAGLRAKGSPPAAGSLKPLVGALEAAHGVGLVHGRLSDENILVEPDGTPYLADLGLGETGSPVADERALEDLASRLPERATPTSRERRRALGPGSAAVAGVVALVLVLPLNEGEQPVAVADAPPAPVNTTAIGSALPSIAVEPLGCRASPSTNAPACTLAQETLDGTAVTVQRAGVIRGWAVRGASGDLALQVIRERDGRSFVVGFSQPERLGDPGAHAFPADIGVRPGDGIGISLAPGAAIGAHSRSSSAIVRWDGSLTAEPRATDGTTADVELMLRADVELGARPDRLAQLVGAEAASAPPGRSLGIAPVSLSTGQGARVVVVDLPGGIAVDVVRGGRLARLEVPDADRDGELLELAQNCGPVGGRGFCLRWRNPGEELALEHAYRVRGNGRIKQIG